MTNPFIYTLTLVSSQAFYNGATQYQQPLYMETKEYGPQPHSHFYYNNYYNGGPEQNELHQSNTPEPGGPQFIFAPQSDPRPPQKVNNGSDTSQSDLLVTPKGTSALQDLTLLCF